MKTHRLTRAKRCEKALAQIGKPEHIPELIAVCRKAFYMNCPERGFRHCNYFYKLLSDALRKCEIRETVIPFIDEELIFISSHCWYVGAKSGDIYTDPRCHLSDSPLPEHSEKSLGYFRSKGGNVLRRWEGKK